jgi:hypothetical protein
MLADRADLNHATICCKAIYWWERFHGYYEKKTPKVTMSKREYRSAIALAMALIDYLEETVYVCVVPHLTNL